MEREEIVSDFAGVDEILEKDGICASLTCGVSMRPLFRTHKDIVIVEKSEGVLKKYDVALYKSGDKYVLHRVIGRVEKTGEYIIRGDNTFTKEFVPESAVIARLVAFRRGASYKTAEALSYKIYSRIWHYIYPARFLLQKCRLALLKIKRIFTKRVK